MVNKVNINSFALIEEKKLFVADGVHGIHTFNFNFDNKDIVLEKYYLIFIYQSLAVLD